MGLPPSADPKKRVTPIVRRYDEQRSEPYPKPDFSPQVSERAVRELFSSKLHEGSNLANPDTLCKVVENLPGIGDPALSIGKAIVKAKKGDFVGAMIEGAKLMYDLHKKVDK